MLGLERDENMSLGLTCGKNRRMIAGERRSQTDGERRGAMEQAAACLIAARDSG